MQRHTTVILIKSLTLDKYHTQKCMFALRVAIIPIWVWQGIFGGCNFASEIVNSHVFYEIIELTQI